MTDRLRIVSEQLSTLGQIESVMGAMQGIASARRSEAQSSLAAMKSYAATISKSIGTILAIADKNGAANSLNGSANELVLVLSAEQGFAGAYNERLLDTAIIHTKSSPGSKLLVVGSRGLMIANSRGAQVFDHLPMVTRVQAIPALASNLVDLLHAHVNQAQVTRVCLIHPNVDKSNIVEIIKSDLLPFDYSRFKQPIISCPPRLNLTPKNLLNKLATEYIYSEICQALVLAHASENEERIRAMVRARSNISTTRDKLTVDFQQLRQEQITAEITELTLGRIASD